MTDRAIRFLQPLQDLLHAISFDERRCILCHIPFSPAHSERPPRPTLIGRPSPVLLPLAGHRLLCPACQKFLHPRQGGYCPLCGNLHALSDASPTLCGECLNTPPPWEHFRFYGLYSGALKTLMLRGKFGADPAVLRLLGHFLARSCADLPTPDAIVPVPLHASRLRERGFNQSQELARPLAEALGVPLMPHLLRRQVATRHQVGLNREERRANLTSAFAASLEARGKRILLIDDTFTTGTTLRKATQALLDVGHTSKTDNTDGTVIVDVAVVARTTLEPQILPLD